MSGKTVYSTGVGRICPGCGWPERDCKCSSRASTESVPNKIVAKLRIEKSGRAGKTVTVVYDLPRNAAFLKELAQELKREASPSGAAFTYDCISTNRNWLTRPLSARDGADGGPTGLPGNSGRVWTLGCDGYVWKPFDLKLLVAEVSTVLDRDHAERSLVRRNAIGEVRTLLRSAI